MVKGYIIPYNGFDLRNRLGDGEGDGDGECTEGVIQGTVAVLGTWSSECSYINHS